MFVNFDEIFNDDPKSQFNIPASYINYLNKGLPTGLKYVIDKEGNYVIIPEGNEIKIGGIKMILNEEQKKILGSKYTLDDILEYAYNSQQPIEIQPIEPGFIQINDKKISIDKLLENPLKPIRVTEGKAYMLPPKFEQEIKIKLGNGKYERMVSAVRVPNNSVNVISVESKKDEPLQVSFNFNKSTNNLKMNISFDLNHAKKIRDIVEANQIDKAVIEKNSARQLLKLICSSIYTKVDENDALGKEKAYKSFQDLAQFLENQNITGIIYPCTRTNKIHGKNIVLFNAKDAEPIKGSIMQYHATGKE